MACRRLMILALTAAALSCGADGIVALNANERNRRVAARVGDRIDITLHTVGPGEFASPPAISSPAIVFLDVAYCGDPNPGGPIQCFHFRATQPGLAVITFTPTFVNAVVQDTIDVR